MKEARKEGRKEPYKSLDLKYYNKESPTKENNLNYLLTSLSFAQKMSLSL